MTSAETNAGSARRIIIFLPLVVLIALAILFYVRLGAGDASRIPSALLDKPAPTFQLPPPAAMPEISGFSDTDLRQGHVTLVNVFASWCVPCHEEHPVLMQLAGDADLRAKGLRIFGIAYKDESENTRRFLGAKGNPYAQIGDDASGRVGIDWGVYGVPETFIVRGDGTIAYKFVGPMTAESVQNTLLPELKKALH